MAEEREGDDDDGKKGLETEADYLENVVEEGSYEKSKTGNVREEYSVIYTGRTSDANESVKECRLTSYVGIEDVCRRMYFARYKPMATWLSLERGVPTDDSCFYSATAGYLPRISCSTSCTAMTPSWMP